MRESQMGRDMNSKDKKPIDIWMVAYKRKEFTENAINYLYTRTDYPYRLFVVDNNSDDGTSDMLTRAEEDGKVFLSVRISRNVGIHMAHNIGLSLVDSSLCVSTDNDIYVPDTRDRDGKCWLTQLVELMDNPKNINYCAVACQPHVFLGAKNLEGAENGVFEAPMAGAVMRIMRTDVVRRVGGWDRHFNANRNHEEKTVCSRIQDIAKGKVGYAEKLVCYHDFGEDNNWGYEDIHPHEHGHRIPGDEIWPPPINLQDIKNRDQKTWEMK